MISGGSFASYPEPGFKILISFRDLTPPEEVVIATAVALDPDAGGDISTDGAVLYPKPSFVNDMNPSIPVPPMTAVPDAVSAAPTKLTVVIYPSSSTVLSTSSIEVSISSFSYSYNSQLNS